ncbi:MAG: hypothetical protein A2X17_00765 [Bacteroidetes bacterium GWF2_41_61]|nr:MAG: hypothetical protein A2X17_00765 [Bacteroidetes bacterium GWF2_41_61]HBG24435.1 4-alpha-glucanotransferase [Rikenellaceae bacterium]
MEVHFSLPFITFPGQEIHITGSAEELEEGQKNNHIKSFYSEGVWHFVMNLKSKKDFTYSYLLKEELKEPSYEAGPPRQICYSKEDNLRVYDQWRTIDDETPFMSNPFRRVFFQNSLNIPNLSGDIIFTLSANNVPSNCSILICGNCKELGEWDISKSAVMTKGEEGIWYYSTYMAKLERLTQYKFVLSSDKGEIVWEEGDNRLIPKDCSTKFSKVYINHFRINIRAKRPRLCGTAIPVFSLRTKNSSGIGDFADILQFIDLLHKTSQNILQILPINDTSMSHTWEDSYPYGAISIYAIHPLYLNLELLGTIKDREFRERHYKKVIRLNKLAEVNYEAVDALKWSYISMIYNQEKDTVLNSKSYRDFYKKNEEWLVPYSVFCFLRDKYKTANFKLWPKYSEYKKEQIYSLIDPKSKYFTQIAIHFYVQYNLHIQLSKAHEYANSKRVILKGDIPIGINRNSVEAWVEPHLFNFDGQAGAPPDDFSVKGQNWGFPTYNWDVMAIDGFSWWRRRFIKMSEYFDAYRIDHILGFFRIWEIPTTAKEGILGTFNPSLPLSIDEINSFGFNFNLERHTKPYINNWVLEEYFGDKSNEVKSEFLESSHDGFYRLKRTVDNQVKIEQYFELNPDSNCSSVKSELLSLCAEVLFIGDSSEITKFHPRISTQFTKSYVSLDDYQKSCFNRIYNHFFYERNEEFWYRNGMRKLPSLISATGMLVCGEDLGMVPACVPAAMNNLKMLSLEIQRMAKNPNDLFGNPSKYPYLSVCTTGTHDTSTLRGWWEEDYEQSKCYYRDVLEYEGEPPVFCEPWLCTRIVDEHLNSPSMLTILPLQDWLSMFPDLRRKDTHSERINIPANPKHYWRYRMHLNIEELIENDNFITTVKTLIQKSGRELES